MTLLAPNSSIASKTTELCEQITQDPNFKKLHADVEQFLGDDAAKLQYQNVHQTGEALHGKQQAGIEIDSEEIKNFEDLRDALLTNPIAADFINAQRSLEAMQKEISSYLNITFELGRVPSREEVEEANNAGGCCGGGGCGC